MRIIDVFNNAGRQSPAPGSAGTVCRDRELEALIDRVVASSNELHILYTKATIASLKEHWQGDPKTIIDQMIDDMPDDVTIFTMNTLDRVPKDEPKPLELYLLSHARALPEFADSKPGWLTYAEASDRLGNGALSVMESMRCLRDEIRTKKFLLGIREAIADLDASGADVIRMCDAGTGAIPILAIYAALCSDKVRCDALELNPNAARIAREVVRECGLQDRIQVRQTDATKFQPEEPLDFLISETMHSGLTAEPIVQILSNLQPYVKDNGMTLPNRVTVQASLVSLADYTSLNVGFVKIYGDRHHVVTEQEWQEVASYKPGDNLEEIGFTLSTGDKPQGKHMVGITSTVDVGSQHIAPYQSLITMPQYVLDTKSDPQIFTIGHDSRETIYVQYKPGDMLNDVSNVR
jgi:precorrin-6B methylase 2